MLLAKPFKLVIEDDRQAVWMTINNTFAKSPQGEWKVSIEQGVLIQLGKSQRWPDLAIMDELSEIQIVRGQESSTIINKMQLEDPVAVWWINITKPGVTSMRAEDLEALRVLPQRSLHKYFVPYPGGITIWPGGLLDIRLQARKDEGEEEHNTYTFELARPVKVELWEVGNRKGKPQVPENLECDEIRIKAGGRKPPPGQTSNPPMYP